MTVMEKMRAAVAGQAALPGVLTEPVSRFMRRRALPLKLQEHVAELRGELEIIMGELADLDSIEDIVDDLVRAYRRIVTGDAKSGLRWLEAVLDACDKNWRARLAS